MSDLSHNCQDGPFPQVPEGYQIVARFPVTSAFKEVFKAIRTTPIGQHDVVLKRYQALSTDQMKSIMKKFHFEDVSQILAKDAITYWAGSLVHPNLVPCDIAVNNLGEIFLVEPLLDATLDKRFPSSNSEFLSWVKGFLTGVEYLHQNGYVHSDIKPENMGLYYGKPVLLDFGISTQLGEILRTRSNPGSIKTRPPELFGEDVTPTTASDMWSLGASFYFMLTRGNYPFLTKEEVASLPAAGSANRQRFEKTIMDKTRLAFHEPTGFRDRLDSTMVRINAPEVFRHLVLSSLSLQPNQRSPASRELGWLEGDAPYFYPQDFWRISSEES